MYFDERIEFRHNDLTICNDWRLHSHLGAHIGTTTRPGLQMRLIEADRYPADKYELEDLQRGYYEEDDPRSEEFDGIYISHPEVYDSLEAMRRVVDLMATPGGHLKNMPQDKIDEVKDAFASILQGKEPRNWRITSVRVHGHDQSATVYLEDERDGLCILNTYDLHLSSGEFLLQATPSELYCVNLGHYGNTVVEVCDRGFDYKLCPPTTEVSHNHRIEMTNRETGKVHYDDPDGLPIIKRMEMMPNKTQRDQFRDVVVPNGTYLVAITEYHY